MSEKYPYSKKNQFDYIEKYQYSKYDGQLFLDLYTENRKKVLTDIRKKTQGNYKSKEGSITIKTHLFRSTQKAYGVYIEAFNTKCFLEYMLSALYNKILIMESHLDILYELIRKYEVTKRLFSSYRYDKKWMRTSDCYDDILIYLLLSNIIGNMLINNYNENRNYKDFNALLKINDLLISSIDQLNDDSSCRLMEKSLCQELIIYNRIVSTT